MSIRIRVSRAEVLTAWQVGLPASAVSDIRRSLHRGSGGNGGALRSDSCRLVRPGGKDEGPAGPGGDGQVSGRWDTIRRMCGRGEWRASATAGWWLISVRGRVQDGTETMGCSWT
jgi:hypothetical protein